MTSQPLVLKSLLRFAKPVLVSRAQTNRSLSRFAKAAASQAQAERFGFAAVCESRFGFRPLVNCHRLACRFHICKTVCAAPVKNLYWSLRPLTSFCAQGVFASICKLLADKGTPCRVVRRVERLLLINISKCRSASLDDKERETGRFLDGELCACKKRAVIWVKILCINYAVFMYRLL